MFKAKYKKYNESIRPDPDTMEKLMRSARKEDHAGLNRKKSPYQWAAVAALVICVSATTACAAGLLVKQVFPKMFASREELNTEAEKEGWDTLLRPERYFDENIYKNMSAQPWIERFLPASEGAVLDQGTDKTLWTRRLTQKDGETGKLDVIYDYPILSDAFRDYSADFDLSYVEKNYPEAAGEYGAVFSYASGDAETFADRHSLTDDTDLEVFKIFSGYRNEQGDFISIEYNMDGTESADHMYYVESDADSAGFYETDDGVKVLLQKITGSEGGTRTDAEVYTEKTHLIVTMYGDFSQEEIYRILNSLKIADGMRIDTDK